MEPYTEKNCTIELHGKTYESGGAVVTDNFLIAYPSKNGQLKDWKGNVIGTYRVISSRKAIFFGHRSWVGNTYYYMRAKVNGREYSLRGFGKGMIAKGKAIKTKTK